MPTQRQTFDQIREIILWQQFNKQIIKLRDDGCAIDDSCQKSFQRFCLANNLFQTLSEDPFFAEIPMAIMTNFSNLNMLTSGNNTWTRGLRDLFKELFALDVELALAEAFDAGERYAKKYISSKPVSPIDEHDDEDELYEVIDQYNTLLEEQRRNFPEVLNDLYELKALAMDGLAGDLNQNYKLVQDRSLYNIDFSESPDKDSLAAMYRKEFCAKALRLIEHMTEATMGFKDMHLNAFFMDAESRFASKRSIIDFINHERGIQLRQSQLIRSFHSTVADWQNANNLYEVKICDFSPLAFLKQPFPEV